MTDFSESKSYSFENHIVGQEEVVIEENNTDSIGNKHQSQDKQPFDLDGTAIPDSIEANTSPTSVFLNHLHELDCIWKKPLTGQNTSSSTTSTTLDSTKNDSSFNNNVLGVQALTTEDTTEGPPSSQEESKYDEYQVHHQHNQEAIEKTKALLSTHLESILSQALEAFHRNDSLERQVFQLSILAQQRMEENQRLKEMESKNRTSLNHLLQALEQGKHTSRELSQHIQMECRLRNDVSTLRVERDTLQGQLGESQNKISVLEEELKLVKAKLTRLVQEKIKMERESRAALSLVMGVDGYNSCDVDYYKRKVSSLDVG